MSFSNGLTPAEAERLAMLAEEAGEIVQAVAKILRHGYGSYHPDSTNPDRDNRFDLDREVNDFAAVVDMMARAGDGIGFDAALIGPATARKLRYAHHQEG